MLNTRYFTPERELYNYDGFIIAYGTDNISGGKTIGRRWEQSTENPYGYPHTFKNPQWFLDHSDATQSTLIGLMASKEADKDEVLEAMKDYMQSTQQLHIDNVFVEVEEEDVRHHFSKRQAQ